MKLDDKLYLDIQRFIELGDDLAERNELEEALIRYQKAYDLLPEPKLDWQAATWILAAIGDTNYFMQDFEACKENMADAMKSPNGVGNPFLHLRLGQAHLELKNEEQAADELSRAYNIEGKAIFEEEDPKYLAFLKTKIDLN